MGFPTWIKGRAKHLQELGSCEYFMWLSLASVCAFLSLDKIIDCQALMELKEELMTNISLQLPHPPNSSPAAVASSREDTGHGSSDFCSRLAFSHLSWVTLSLVGGLFSIHRIIVRLNKMTLENCAEICEAKYYLLFLRYSSSWTRVLLCYSL